MRIIYFLLFIFITLKLCQFLEWLVKFKLNLSIHFQHIVQSILSILFFVIIFFGFFIICKKKKNDVVYKSGGFFSHNDYNIVQGISFAEYNKKILHQRARIFADDGKCILKIPYSRLSRTTTILGNMGSGKSRLMGLIESDIRKKYPNIPILIHDPKGEWLRTLYNPKTDLIFAPFDKRTFKWDIWKEFTESPYLKNNIIATAVENHLSNHDEQFWADSAKKLLKQALAQPSLEQAKYDLQKQKDLNSDNKTFLSSYSNAILAFEDIVAIQNSKASKSYSVKDLLNHKGRIFLLNNPATAEEQKGSLALMLSALMLECISMPDVQEKNLRILMLIDEALTFRLPKAIDQAVYTQCRSKGLAIVASSQRLPDKYKGEFAGWATSPNQLIAMRVEEQETKRILSDKIGIITYDELQESETSSKANSTTQSYVERSHRLLNPEDFSRLENRELIFFDETSLSVGKVLDFNLEQNQNINMLEYDERDDIIDFMNGL